NGTLVGSPTYTTGKINQAIVLNGTSQYVSAPSSTTLDITGSGITLSTWAKATAPGLYKYLIGKTDASTGGYALYTGASGSIVFYIGTGSLQSTPNTVGS